MSTTKGLLWPNEMEPSRVDGRGIDSWFGDWVYRGSQVSSNSSAFSRSEIGLVIVLHLSGPFAPPKVSLIDMRTYNVPFRLI